MTQVSALLHNSVIEVQTCFFPPKLINCVPLMGFHPWERGSPCYSMAQHGTKYSLYIRLALITLKSILLSAFRDVAAGGEKNKPIINVCNKTERSKMLSQGGSRSELDKNKGLLVTLDSEQGYFFCKLNLIVPFILEGQSRWD